MSPLDDLKAAVEAASADLRADRPAPRAVPTLERPPKAEMGDYSTNAAMLLSKVMGQPPRAVAEQLAPAISERLGERLDRVDIAGPGFLNLFLSDAWYAEALAGILEAGDAYGADGAGLPERVNVEFVSANPTGPVHLGHARNAAYGDALSRVLDFHGHTVHREFYVNDAGSQIASFTESIRARMRGEEPEQYLGEYVVALAEELRGTPDDQLADAAVERMLALMRASLDRFRVEPFDTWFREHTLYEGAIEHTLERLRERGVTYESDGALWLRSTDYGDDKDRVLVKSDGTYTYLTPDIAYHQHKRERGFERLVDVWGADHHGYVTRMKAAYAALGGDPDELDLLIMQFAHLVRGGEKASLSKRAGQIVTLDDLVEEIGVDAARWFLLARSHDTTIDIDLDLAVQQNPENPVYYVQYAHARVPQIFAKAGGAAPDPSSPGTLEPVERELIAKLLGFPGEVREAAERRAPHRIANYALDVARTFHVFYDRCRVVGSDQQGFRLAECEATRRIVARSLALLGVTAPDSM
jgi:arginyl-tRNA synthetase